MQNLKKIALALGGACVRIWKTLKISMVDCLCLIVLLGFALETHGGELLVLVHCSELLFVVAVEERLLT